MMDSAAPLSKRIEAVLFVYGDSMDVGRLAEILGARKTDVMAALTELDERLKGRALTVVYHGDDVQLVTRDYLGDDIEKLVRDEHAGGLSRAAAETLAVVAYRGPLSKKDIDYIRGVNSVYALRNLCIRGFIRKRVDEKNRKIFMYEPTLDFLKFLGVSRMSDLPEYDVFRAKMQEFSDNASLPIREL